VLAVIDIDSGQGRAFGYREQAAGIGVDQAAVTAGRDAVTRHCQKNGVPLRNRSRQPTVPLTYLERERPRFGISQPLQIDYGPQTPSC
jgi:hypothetical protein